MLFKMNRIDCFDYSKLIYRINLESIHGLILLKNDSSNLMPIISMAIKNPIFLSKKSRVNYAISSWIFPFIKVIERNVRLL